MITILTPTRGRPAKLTRCINSAMEASDKAMPFEFLCYVDLDDSCISAYKNLSLPNTRIIYGNPKSVSVSWNDLAAEALGDIFMMGNDDLVFITEGWNRAIENEAAKFPDQVYCIWCNDWINGGAHCAFPTVSRKWYETVGYFTPGIFDFLFNDTWIYSIAKMIGRCSYIPDVIIRHYHWGSNPNEDDATYSRNRKKKDYFAGDKELFERTVEDREKVAEKLRSVMGEYTASSR